jgi:tripeptide aminopeptidase
MESVLERFFRYVKIDTQSDPLSTTSPSTLKQLDLARLLVKECQALGLQDVRLNEYGNVIATLPATTNKKIPTIGFMAHMDTSPSLSGAGVKPRLVENYDGKDIVLNAEKNIILSPHDFPELANFTGQTLIVTDGTTLLGADDKAGIAEIMTAIHYLADHPQIKHGKIRVAFTPDEEVGTSIDHFDVKEFGCDYAYTLDGGQTGELQYETFNAASARITIHGRSVHPGVAKNKMINAIQVGMEIDAQLPAKERPQFTEKYEGFFHLDEFSGNVEQVEMVYIIRDHDRKIFEKRKEQMRQAVDKVSQVHGAGIIDLTLNDQYYNMKEKILPVKHIVDIAEKAMNEIGIKPIIIPVRGGTDGSRLSFMDLPTPNLFTGGMNAHGKFEFASVQAMNKAVDVIIKIAELYAK